MKLLSVGLEPDQIEALESHLAGVTLDVFPAAHASRIPARLAGNRYAALLARDDLGDFSALDLIRSVRQRSGIPLIMIAAPDDGIGRIVGLELGADDYICTPFDPRELLARIRAVVRRVEQALPAPPLEDTLESGNLRLDRRGRKVYVNGDQLLITGAEFRMLEKLLAARGEPVSRDALATHALGRELAPNDRCIDTHMSRLRKKLGPFANGEPRIQSVRGHGYLIPDIGAALHSRADSGTDAAHVIGNL